MQSKIFTVNHDDGTYQKFQVVSDFLWRDVHYFSPQIEASTITELIRLYKVNILPKIFKSTASIVFFHVPKGFEVPFCRDSDIGYIYDDDILLKNVFEEAFKKGELKVENEHLVSENEAIGKVIEELEKSGMIGCCENKGKEIFFIAVYEHLGFISSKKSSVSVNSHFFLMDPTDMDSPYCKIGTPHGLSMENGYVKSPPLNHRSLLLVDSKEKATVTKIELKDMAFSIDDVEYIPGENCEVHFRPDEYKSPKHSGSDIIITENHVIAIKDGGESIIPVAGFVLSLPTKIRVNDTHVLYKGFEDYLFAAQVGPEMVVDSVMKDRLDFPFFQKEKDKVVYAPTVYPLPYESARAARICLGSDKDDKPVIIWAEGEGKLGIDKHKDSTGASLLEMAQFCASQGFKNIINLDGGGSAQIIFNQARQLKIADRLPITNKECERPVPNGIMIL